MTNKTLTLPSSSSVISAMFGVKRGKRAREEEEDESEESSTNEKNTSPNQLTSSLEQQKTSHEQKQQQHQKQMSPAKMAHMLLHYQNKVRSCKRLLATLKREKERDLSGLVDQLALLESRLRREQRDIQEQLSQRNTLVHAQRLEIERLSRDNERLSRDNRRLAHKVKKYATAVGDKDGDKREKRVKFSRLESIENDDTSNDISDYPLSNINFVTNASDCLECANLLDTGLNSHYQEGSISHITYSHIQSSDTSSRNSHPIYEADNHNLPGFRPKSDRVFHKPPIAEKPKGLRETQRLKRIQSHGIFNVASSNIHTVEEESDDICTSVLTKNIRLGDEESDETCTAGSSASEPSSPESILKVLSPKAISMSIHFDEELDQTNSSRSSRLLPHSPPSDSSLEIHTSEVSNIKSYIMDEYEVTSGYNSDAVSDHDYENIRFGTTLIEANDNNTTDQHQTKESINNTLLSDKEEDEHNTSVIFNPIESKQSLVDLNEDQTINSNVEFSDVVQQTNEVEIKEEDNQRDEERQKQRADESEVIAKVKEELDVSYCSTASDEPQVSRIVDSNNSARSRESIINLLDRNHMTDNFEEFKLDALELEKDDQSENFVESFLAERNSEKKIMDVESNKVEEKEKENLPVIKDERSVAGYENIVGPPMSPVGGGDGGQYEKFLEATGLSQKSILTPTRSLINHRSVVKPRDIKQRNKKLRNSFTTLGTLQETPQKQHRRYTQPYI